MENAMQLAKHSKHTPKLLRHQVLCALMKKYVPTEDDRESLDPSGALTVQTSETETCGPTIQRFHGALLFVDISGFTALSTKLDVETLKNHINSYFSKMLDIVEKWEGDVIKFAGDALFIVWPTVMDKQSGAGNNTSRSVSSNLSGHTQFAIAAKRSLEKAVACGLEISTVCGNYEVKLPTNEGTTDSPSLMNKLLPNFSFFTGGAAKIVPAAPPSDTPQESVVFLNVHSGVSCGLMAGVDIIHGNRGEFFLVGDPLTGVAMAESQASKGDVVLDVAAHELLHGDNATAAVNKHLGAVGGKSKGGAEDSEEGTAEKKEEEEEICVVHSQGASADGCLTCGCLKTTSGLFRVSRLLTRIPKDLDKKKTRGKMKADHAQVRTEWGLINMRQYEDIQYDIEKLYSSAQHSIKREFFSFLKNMHAEEEPLDWKVEEKKFGGFLKEQVKTHFLEWMEHILGDVITQHVHEVARLAQKVNRKRLSSFMDLLQESRKVMERTRSDYALLSPMLATAPDSDVAESGSGRMLSPDEGTSRDDILGSPAVMEERVKRDSIKPSSQHHKSSFSTELNNGEIRTVIVLFIKIEKFDLRLRIDSVGKPRTFAYNRFSFLDRTESEIEADEQLMQRFQACFSVLCKALSDHGGQLRQFIVDDKGTVCIGTFGLRGSASVDNAAAALEAAKNVVTGLKGIGLSASIGITSGKGYCGLVGSSSRHEYAVMGPSTNLSARLMCKAPAHGIICDSDTVGRDRTHRFIQLAEITAKGYAKPVTIFRPAFENDNDMEISGRPGAKKSVRGNAKNWNMSHVGLKRAAEEANGVLSAANLATLTALQRMIEVAKSDFYISETKPNLDSHDQQKSASTQKLYGRRDLIITIFAFLFDNDAADCQSLSFKAKVKMAVICGASGLGKSAMLNAIERKLIHIARTDPKCNMLFVRNRASSLHSDVPFFGVRSIIQKLLMIINKLHRRADDIGDNRGSNRIAANMNARDLQLLFFSMIAQPEDPNSSSLVTCLLSDAYMTQAQAEDMSTAATNYILRSVTQFVSKVSKELKKLLFLIIEDFHTLDKWSILCFHSIWKDSFGAAILACFCSTESSLSYNETPSAKEVYGDAVTKFFRKFTDAGRFKTVNLEPLSKETTMAIVAESIVDVGSADLEKIYEASAGSPLYIAELVKSMMKTGTLEETATGLLKVEGQALAGSLTVALNANSYRIEEVILYRLDKLHISLQMMLKAIAVAVSYGKGLTLALLQHMLADNAYFHTDKNHGVKVGEGLLELLKTEEFLVLKNMADVDKKQLQLSDLATVEFDFRIPLEQSSIYSLLVDEQKEFFHEKVAMFWYLQLRNKPLVEVPLKDLWEQGYHWDRAALWSRALKSYLLGAKKCKDEKSDLKCAESLLMAYQMFQNLEQEVCSIHLPESCFKYADRMAHFLFDPSTESYNALAKIPDLNSALSSAKDVFEHDPAAIVDAVELHILLAEIYLSKWEDFNETMHILQVAVALCLASAWKSPLKSISTESVKRRKSLDSSSGDHEYVNKTRCLDKKDYLQVFSMCAYVSRLLEGDNVFNISFEHSKNLLLEKDEEDRELTEEEENEEVAWIVQVETMMIIRLLHLGKTSKAITIAEELINKYDVEIHSPIIVNMFGLDLVPYALAILAQALICGRNLKRGVGFWYSSAAYLAQMTHGYSFVVAFISLLGTVRFTGEYETIMGYLQIAQAFSTMGFDSLGTRFGILLQIWLQLGIMQKAQAAGKELPNFANTCASLYRKFDHVSREVEAEVNSHDTGAGNNNGDSQFFEMSVNKLAYIELHGCALERIYVGCIGRLWSFADKANIFQLEQRLQSSLQILLQCPTYDYMSVVAKSINLLNCLIQVIHTSHTDNGSSAAAIFLAVSERSDQHLLQLIQSLQHYDCVNMAWFMAALATKLPLHEGIREEYNALQQGCTEKIVDTYTDETSQAEFLQGAKKVGIDGD